MPGKSLGVAMSVVGESTSDPVGFYGTDGIAQRASAAQSALTLTTATSAGFGFSTSGAFNAAVAQIEEIRATLVALGLMKGSS
jgi:hypothetical protein